MQLTVRRAGTHAHAVASIPRYNTEAKTDADRLRVRLRGQTVRRARRPPGRRSARCGTSTTQTLTGFGKALTSSKTRSEVSSIVGITEDAHETVVAGAGYALVFLGFISLVLAVINLFPFLPLDGGHVLWSVAEKVRGRRISLAAMYRFSSVGIVLLLFLVINGISNDISRLGG